MVFSGCKKSSQTTSDALGTYLLFDNASPDAREALATPVDFQLTDENYAQWELAQQHLEALPASALPAVSGRGGGNVIDRAVARLESSPRARTAVERTGLSVRDFVLATIALAQATEARATGKMVGTSQVAAQNVQFVERYGSRILRARGERRVTEVESEDYSSQSDSASQVDEAPLIGANGQEEERMHEPDSTAMSGHAETDPQARRDTIVKPTREPARDTARDTLPTR
jgi:hypothetical protein